MVVSPTSGPEAATARSARHCLFLSHSSADKDAARNLKQRILASPAAQAAGLTVWFDEDRLVGNVETWQKLLEDALETEMTAFAVYVGSRGIVNWVEREVRAGLARATGPAKIPFIPILAKESKGIDALPYFARQHQTVGDPADDPAALAEIISAALGTSARPRLIDDPFVGLRAMTEKESDRFFGRKQETDELIERMKRFRLAAIVAESGSGKSSLAQAGIIPRFRGGALEDAGRAEPEGRIRHVLVVRPKSDPAAGLREAVTRAAETLGLSGDQRASLRQRVDLANPEETAFALQCDLPVDKVDTLLVVDQFEELMTMPVPQAERDRFVGLLLALAERSGPCDFHILITVRSDYFTPFLSNDGLKRKLSGENADAVYRLRRISDAGIEEAVKRPLEMAGHEDVQEQDALARLVQRDTMDRAGDLALIQAALRATWLRSGAGKDSLVNAYAALGGVPGALANEAEAARGRLKGEAQQLLSIFVRLIQLGATGGVTRRVALLDAFDTARRAVIDKLTTDEYGRLLLTTDKTVEIAHEALVTQWAWLNSEINAVNTPRDIRRLDLLMDKTDAWLGGAQDTGKFGATGAELETLGQLRRDRPDWLNKDEQGFLDSSVKLVEDAKQAVEDQKQAVEDQKRRTRLLYWGVAASVAVALAVAGLWAYSYQVNKLELEAADELAAIRLAAAEERAKIELAAAAQRAETLRLGGLVSTAERDLNAGDGLSALSAARDVLKSPVNADNEFYRGRAFAIAYAGLQKRLPERTLQGTLLGERAGRIFYRDSAADKTSIFTIDASKDHQVSEINKTLSDCGIDFCYDEERLYGVGSAAEIKIPDGYEVFATLDEGDVVLSKGDDLFHARLPELKPIPIGRFLGDSEWGDVSVFAAGDTAVLITGDAALPQGESLPQEGESSIPEGYVRATLFRDDFLTAVFLKAFGSTYFPNLAVFNADATLLATSAGDPSMGHPAASIWDARTGELLASTLRAETKTSSLAFAEASKRLIVGNENGELTVFDAKDGTIIAMLASLSGKVIGIDVDVEAHRICAVWSNGTLGVWDSISLLELQRVTFPAYISPKRTLCRGGRMYVELQWGGIQLIQRWNISNQWQSEVIATNEVPMGGMGITGFSIDAETAAPAVDLGIQAFECTQRWIPGKNFQDCNGPTVNDFLSQGAMLQTIDPAEGSDGWGYLVKDDRFCFVPTRPDGSEGDPVCPIELNGEVPKFFQSGSFYSLLVTEDADGTRHLTVLRAADLQVVVTWRNTPISFEGIYSTAADKNLNNLVISRYDDTLEVWNLASKSLTIEAQSRFIFHGEGWRTFATDFERGLLATYGDGFTQVYRFGLGADDLVRMIDTIVEESRYVMQ